MRRAAAAALLLLFLTTAAARADELTLQLEAGTELDSNAHRAPKDLGEDPAAVGRIGVRLDTSGRAGDVARYSASALGAAKAFTSSASSEDLAVVAGDGSVDLGSGAVAPGLRLSYYDVYGQNDSVLTLRTGDAAAALTLRAGDVRVAGTAGWRFFIYKSEHDFDFDGPHGGLSVGATARGDDGSWQLRWGAAYVASVRGYSSQVFASGCAPGVAVTPACLVVGRDGRSDLYHDLAVDLAYTGSFLLGLRLGLQVDDSNSFGQSLVRGRAELSGTADLFFDIVGTAKLVLEVDAYPDGLLLGQDLGTFVTIEDEARNAIVLHFTRELDESWTLEARLAAYMNPFAAQASAYQRQTAYFGVVYTFRSRGR